MADIEEYPNWFNGYVLNLAALGLTIVALIMLLITVTSNSWMTGYDDGEDYLFGLSEYEESKRYSSEFVSYDSKDCPFDEECDGASSAGTVGLVFLCIAILSIMASIVFLCLNNFGVYESNFSMTLSFLCGGSAICGAILWVFMFPEIGSHDNVGLGSSFYFTLIGGIFSIGSGFCLLQSHEISEPIWRNVLTNLDEFTGYSHGTMSRVSLGLMAGAILVMLVSIFSNSWMTFSEDKHRLDFGLYNAEYSHEDGEGGIFDYSYPEWCDDECQDVSAAGTTGSILLWLAVLSGVGSLILICLNRSEIFESNYGMIAGFVCGGLAVIGAIVWAVMFPEEFEDLEGSFGIAFYSVILAGLLSIASAVIELKFIELDEI